MSISKGEKSRSAGAIHREMEWPVNPFRSKVGLEDVGFPRFTDHNCLPHDVVSNDHAREMIAP